MILKESECCKRPTCVCQKSCMNQIRICKHLLSCMIHFLLPCRHAFNLQIWTRITLCDVFFATFGFSATCSCLAAACTLNILFCFHNSGGLLLINHMQIKTVLYIIWLFLTKDSSFWWPISSLHNSSTRDWDNSWLWCDKYLNKI